LIAAFAELELFSPITVRIPYAAYTSGSYPLPPPSTIKGALAYAYARHKGIPEAVSHRALEEVGREVRYASAGYTGVIAFAPQLERFYQAVYQKPERREQERFRWGAYHHGAYFVYPRLLVFLVLRSEKMVPYAHAITRLGRKETLASVAKVVWGEPEILSEAQECHPFYYPEGVARVDTEVYRFRIGEEAYELPIAHARINISPGEGGVIVRVGDYCAPAPRFSVG